MISNQLVGPFIRATGPATDITNWRAFKVQPFAFAFGAKVVDGSCLFDTGSLFVFAGPMNADADNVVVVLWGFPSNPDDGDTGDGQLFKPPAAGPLEAGAITWELGL